MGIAYRLENNGENANCRWIGQSQAFNFQREGRDDRTWGKGLAAAKQQAEKNLRWEMFGRWYHPMDERLVSCHRRFANVIQ
jgi:hypothetical protein